MRRWTLFGIWSLVLALTTALTWQIVSAADNRVNDRPLAVNIASPITGSADTTPVSIAPGAESTLPELTPTTAATTSSTAGTVSTNPPTTTTRPSPPTTEDGTTTTTTNWSYETIPTKGGTVVLAYRPDEVVLQTATPSPGYHTEVKKPGPPKVEVEFESNDLEIKVRAEWRDGELNVDVVESEKD